MLSVTELPSGHMMATYRELQVSVRSPSNTSLIVAASTTSVCNLCIKLSAKLCFHVVRVFQAARLRLIEGLELIEPKNLIYCDTGLV